MKKRLFFRNTIVVMISSVLFQTVGIGFRVYLSSKIGAESIGVYQLIIAVYGFVLTFTSSGISLATTRLVTDYTAKGKQSYIRKTMTLSLACVLVLSLVLGFSMFFSSDFIGSCILSDTRTILPLKILSVSLPFVAISSVCRGYFYALRQIVKTTGEQFIEQAVEIAVFIALIGLKADNISTEYACYAMVMGTLSAEIITAVYSIVLYRLDIRHINNTVKVQGGEILKRLATISAPVSANACLRSGLSTAENILIPRGLKQNGASYEKALFEYGMITGMVMPIIAFPGSVLVALSMLLIPEISEANAKQRKKEIRYITSKVFGITFMFSVMVSGTMFFFGKEIGIMLYANEEVGAYISLIAPLVPLTYLDSMVDAILKGLNDQLMYLTYNLIDSTMRIILVLVLLPIMGVKGLIIVIFASEILNSTLSIMRLIKLISLKFKLFKWIIKPYSAIIISGVIVNCINTDIFGATIDCIIKIVCTISIYIVLLFLSRAFDKEDISYIKRNFLLLKPHRPVNA